VAQRSYTCGNLSPPIEEGAAFGSSLLFSQRPQDEPPRFIESLFGTHDLGFGAETARLHIKFYRTNPKPAWNLTEEQVGELRCKLWGHGDGRFTHLTGNFEWDTPDYIVEAARALMGSIDIDPASCALANKLVKAAKYYTKKDEGLKQEWPGNVFINPPFAHPTVQHFAEKLIDQYMRGITRQAIWLSNASTGAKWWRDLAPKGLVCLTEPLSFDKAEGRDFFWQHKTSGEEFAEIGTVMEVMIYASD
jgi:hypothetical protein